MVWADKEKMSIVIRNIISNAFKFTHSGGSIYITTGLTDDGKRCYVRVEDNGVGIPQNKLTEIFERFSQGENAKNSYYQGTGIGLALSKEIVNLHHGQIRAESPEGQGAVFIVELLMDKEHYRPSEVDFYVGDTETAPIAVEQDPVANAISEDGTEEEEPEIDASLPTLLLVEDNKDLCQLIKLQLEDKFNIHIANNGVEGLKKVHLYHPDIVVTDQMMPEMDGLELCDRIKSDLDYSHIPIVLLTAKTTLQSKIDGLKSGADAYIEKPFSVEYLKVSVANLLSNHEKLHAAFAHSPFIQTNSMAMTKADETFLKTLNEVIVANMQNPDFCLDDMASLLNMSRSSLNRKIKGVLDMTPNDYIRLERLKKAAQLLREGECKVNEVCYMVGFNTPSYFTKCFQKQFGILPKDFVK